MLFKADLLYERMCLEFKFHVHVHPKNVHGPNYCFLYLVITWANIGEKNLTEKTSYTSVSPLRITKLNTKC